MEASNGAVFLGGHHRHSATLRESVDAVAYVARGFIGYAFMSMFCWDLNPDFEYAVFRSRDRAPAWARSMVEDEK